MNFSYTLPPERIAQRPAKPYDTAKLLVIDRARSEITEHIFKDIAQILTPNELLVVNQTGVIPARLFGVLESGREAEVLLINQLDRGVWRVFAKPGRYFKPLTKITFSNDLRATVRINEQAAGIVLEFDEIKDQQEIYQRGSMPIPTYIREGKGDSDDLSDYQTLFAKNKGSIAAPTASLHFTPELLKQLDQNGVARSYVTLHLGAASFLPLDRFEPAGPPASEKFELDDLSFKQIKEFNGKVVAVGTSVVRALESAALGTRSETSLFIQPGHQFQLVDGLITNFHQPGTTHLALVEALLGHELIKAAYEYALAHDFRFLSYGDAMYIKA